MKHEEEGDARDRLTDACKERGWLCWKLETDNRRGLPDWLVLVEFPVFAFVELKAPGKKAKTVQGYIHGFLQRKGFPVCVAVGVEKVDQLLQGLEARRREANRPRKESRAQTLRTIAYLLQERIPLLGKTRSRSRPPRRKGAA